MKHKLLLALAVLAVVAGCGSTHSNSLATSAYGCRWRVQAIGQNELALAQPHVSRLNSSDKLAIHDLIRDLTAAADKVCPVGWRRWVRG